MGFTATAFLAAVEQIADQISVQAMLAAEIGNGDALAVKHRAGLLGGQSAVHSVIPCLIVFDEKDSWPENWSSQLVLIKKMLIAAGIGERLREERDRLGMNQTDFGVAAGVSRGTQKAYELESSSPDIRYLCALQGMDVDVHYILTGSRISQDPAGLSPEEAQVLEQFRSLPAKDRDAVSRLTAGLVLMKNATT